MTSHSMREQIANLIAQRVSLAVARARLGTPDAPPEVIGHNLAGTIDRIIDDHQPEPEPGPDRTADHDAEPRPDGPLFEAADFEGDRIEISPYGNDHASVIIRPATGEPAAVILPRYEATKAAAMLVRASAGKNVITLDLPDDIEIHPDKPPNTGIGNFEMIGGGGIIHRAYCGTCGRHTRGGPIAPDRIQYIGAALGMLGRLAAAEPPPAEVDRLAETLIEAGAPSEVAWNAARVVLRRFNLSDRVGA